MSHSTGHHTPRSVYLLPAFSITDKSLSLQTRYTSHLTYKVVGRRRKKKEEEFKLSSFGCSHPSVTSLFYSKGWRPWWVLIQCLLFTKTNAGFTCWTQGNIINYKGKANDGKQIHLYIRLKCFLAPAITEAKRQTCSSMTSRMIYIVPVRSCWPRCAFISFFSFFFTMDCTAGTWFKHPSVLKGRITEK